MCCIVPNITLHLCGQVDFGPFKPEYEYRKYTEPDEEGDTRILHPFYYPPG